MTVSDCCWAPMTGLSEAFRTCSKCHEHCSWVNDEDGAAVADELETPREFSAEQQATIDYLMSEAEADNEE
jgi:hypothetical protein